MEISSSRKATMKRINRHSIRVNDQRRLIIEIKVKPELTTIIVDLVDYH